MNWKLFLQLIRLLAEKKISREHFILDWELLQRDTLNSGRNREGNNHG
jgi:hypothetical protein